jgi:hypothetical protein
MPWRAASANTVAALAVLLRQYLPGSAIDSPTQMWAAKCSSASNRPSTTTRSTAGVSARSASTSATSGTAQRGPE